MELTKIQQEVINRMKILKLHENVVRDYVDDNVINVSERMSAVFDGMLFWAHEDLTKTIRDFEEKYGVIVYHVQKNEHNVWFALYVSICQRSRRGQLGRGKGRT